MKQRLAQVRRRCANYWTTHIVQWHLRLALFGRRLRAWLGASAVSLFSFAIAAAILIVPQFRATVDNFQPLEAVLSQLGATYGTILALVLTLSIIPIQRAAEVWSSSIVRLYRRDPVTYATFVLLGVFCAASFFLAVRGLFLVPVSVVFALSLVVLGISLDILRWYHGHVCRLLNPVYAVSLALKEARKAIDRTKTHVTRISRLQYQLLSAEQQRAANVEAIESTIYPRIPGYPDSINFWINDLAEIGIKAVARGEKLLAKTAVFAITDLTLYYLSSRKFNLTLRSAPEAMFLVMTSDVSVVDGPCVRSPAGGEPRGGDTRRRGDSDPCVGSLPGDSDSHGPSRGAGVPEGNSAAHLRPHLLRLRVCEVRAIQGARRGRHSRVPASCPRCRKLRPRTLPRPRFTCR